MLTYKLRMLDISKLQIYKMEARKKSKDKLNQSNEVK
jgi:hypothetical protein